MIGRENAVNRPALTALPGSAQQVTSDRSREVSGAVAVLASRGASGVRESPVDGD